MSAEPEDSDKIAELEPDQETSFNILSRGSQRFTREGEITARQAEQVFEDYAAPEFELDLPQELEAVNARIEWRSEVDSIDVYLDGSYEQDRNLAYRLLSTVAPVESTRELQYDDSFSLRDMAWEDFMEIGNDYGLE